MKEKVDREEETGKVENVFKNDDDENAEETEDNLINSNDISRNDRLEPMEQGEKEERTGDVENKPMDKKLGDTEEQPGETRENGQQLIWKYMSVEKSRKVEIEETNQDTAHLRTSNIVTSPATRNKICMVGSDVVPCSGP